MHMNRVVIAGYVAETVEVAGVENDWPVAG